MDCSTPGLPVHHKLPEFTQTHIHWVSDAIQPSLPLLSPSPPAFNLSQHQGLFKCVSSSHQVAKVLEFQPQHQSFQWILCFVHYYFPFILIYFDQLYDMSKLLNLCELQFTHPQSWYIGNSCFRVLSRVKVKVKSLSRVWLFETPWTVAYQAPPSMGFSRQEYWSGLPFPSTGDLPDPGIRPRDQSQVSRIGSRHFNLWAMRGQFKKTIRVNHLL